MKVPSAKQNCPANLLGRNWYAKAAVAMLMLLVLAIPAQRIVAQTPATSNETCSVNVLRPELRAATAFESQQLAEQVTASILASYDNGYNASYNSLFNSFTWNTVCSVTVQSVTVVYDLSSKAANYTLDITLNPSLTAVTGVREQPAQPLAGICYSTADHNDCNNSSNTNNVKWVGPEYYDSSGITQANSDWEIPSIQGDGGEVCACQFIEWTGLASQAFGASGLAQAGSASICWYSACTSASDNAYYLWYDFPTANLVNCTTEAPGETTINSGDSISTDIYPQNGYYYADAFDSNVGIGGYGCDGKSSSGYMSTAYYAEYMGEANYGPLPDFSTLSFSSSQYYDSSSHYISSSWTTGYIINESSSSITCDGNSVNYNVCPSGVDGSSGSFTETWETSSGT